MMMANMNVLAHFDELMLQMKEMYDGTAETNFLTYVQTNINTHDTITTLKDEVARLQNALLKSEQEVNCMQMKLKNAKLLLDSEKMKFLKVEKEKSELQKQVAMVLENLGQEQINKTHERLQSLSNSLSCHLKAPKDLLSPNHSLTTITEKDDLSCMDSLLSVSDIDFTNGEDMEVSQTRSGRSYGTCIDGQANGNRKRRSSDTNGNTAKRQSKAYNKENVCDQLETPIAKRIHSNATAPPAEEFYDATAVTPKPPRTPFAHYITPMQNMVSRSTLPATPFSATHPFSKTPIVRSSTSRINLRPHCFSAKVIYWIDFCRQCDKRLKLGRPAYKCRECRATCHIDCKDLLPLPCVPTANTPGAKHNQEVVGDFAPSVPPMVPGIIVHCTNEIENKGMTEVGIYRVSGSENDVKELKEKFLKGKGMPNMASIDVHVICGALKLFLRSLKEPLVTFALWHTFIEAAQIHDPQERTAALYQALSDLPQPNRDTIAWMVLHLQRVAESSDCKMPLQNLAKVFAPTIIGFSVPQPDPATILNETHLQQIIMERLLEISSDYWDSYLLTCDEVTATPEVVKVKSRRKSTMKKSPFEPRDYSRARM